MRPTLFVGVSTAAAAVVAAAIFDGCHAAKVQSSAAKGNQERAGAIKAAFQASFSDYLEYAEGADELLPLSKKGTGGFGDWGATYIDALTTAHIMGIGDIVASGITFAERVDFTKTEQSPISFFETNIRFVAGLLSIYELTGSGNAKLLQQAETIAQRLLRGFVGNNDIPYNALLDWSVGPSPNTTKRAIVAEAGTLLIEMDRLSKFTNNVVYRQHAERSMRAVINSTPVLPGLYGQGIDPKNNSATNDYVTWGGGTDSYFEYLVKYGQLIGAQSEWIPAWVTSVKSSIQYLVTKPGGTDANITFLADYSPSRGGVIPQFSHLGCFAGGNWILGGKLLNSDEIFHYGLALADGCAQTYANSATGIGPEVFVFKTASGGTNRVNITDPAFYQKNGWTYKVNDYVLRPEVIESMFYAYRATGDTVWQDRAWAAWQAISKYCKAPAAYASLEDVSSTSTKQVDDSESFLYAETFKYLYLIFDDPGHISLDEYVFNTEAHPFKMDKPYTDFSRISVGDVPSPATDAERAAFAAAHQKTHHMPGTNSLSGTLHELGDKDSSEIVFQAAEHNKHGGGWEEVPGWQLPAAGGTFAFVAPNGL